MVTSGLFEYTRLGRVAFGRSVAETLPGILNGPADAQDKPRVMAVLSSTLASEHQLQQQLQTWLGDQLVATFSGVRAHSPRPDVMRALTVAREADADVLLSIGGGSIIDACKVVQMCLNADIRDEAQLVRYARFSDGSAGDLCGTQPAIRALRAVRQIAVPTTLSAAEFSNNAGISDPAKAAKEGYRAPSLSPQAVLYDPYLAMLTPMWLWLSTAVRSLDHAIEGYCSPDAYPYVQGHYLHAIRLLSESLPATHRYPERADLRTLNQQAVWLAGCALGSVRHGASHGIGYVLGAQCGVPHGYTSCVMLPAVLDWNRNVTAARQAEIAAAAGCAGNDLGDWLRSWLQSMGLPVSLQELGISREQMPAIARAAARNSVVKNNPRPVRSEDDVMEILALAWQK